MSVVRECAHHWIIESPEPGSGSMSKGVCKHCGEERMFDNTAGQGKTPIVLQGTPGAPHSRSRGGDTKDYYEGEEAQE